MPLALLRQQLADVIHGAHSATPGLSTGLKALDTALPGHGLPRGRLTELVGAPGSGKGTQGKILGTIPRLFLDRLTVDGARPAVLRDGAEPVRYQAFARQAGGVARRLTEAGVQPGDTVALAGPRSLELLAAIYGVLMAGGAYVPLGTDQPGALLKKKKKLIPASAAMAMAMGLRPSRSDSRPAAMVRPNPISPPGIRIMVTCPGV